MPIDTIVDNFSLIYIKVNSPLGNHITSVSLEISANTCSWEKCAPFLGASLLGFVKHPFVCYLFMVVDFFLLKNIVKYWLGFLPLLRRVSHDTSCVLVHGVSSFDLCFYNKLSMV
jgi:hypothetical protein